MSGSDDLEDLLEAAAGGDRRAFAALYQATSAKLFGVILRILVRHDWAEDVLQETYLAVWRHAGRFQARKGRPMTWLITIARNRALDRRRRERATVSFDDHPARETVADNAPSPLENTIQSAEARSLSACLEELEAVHRDCITLAYRDGLSHSELAARLDRPLGTVKSWIRRGQMQLKECLER